MTKDPKKDKKLKINHFSSLFMNYSLQAISSSMYAYGIKHKITFYEEILKNCLSKTFVSVTSKFTQNFIQIFVL